MAPFSESHGIKKNQKSRSGRKILIDQSKQQQLSLISGFRGIARHLKSQWTVELNTEKFIPSTFDDVRAVVIAAPKLPYSSSEIDALHSFMQEGGGLLVLLGEGQQVALNVNGLLSKYGISANADCVIRTIYYYKYFDPKEALVSNGVVNRAVAAAAKKPISSEQRENAQSLVFVYPFGCTLNVERKATVALSSGSACFPVARPIAVLHQVDSSQDQTMASGRIAVVGSLLMFHDNYIDKEENGKIFDVFIDYITSSGFELNTIDATEPDINHYMHIPDLLHLSEQLKVCMFEGDMNGLVSTNFIKTFDASLSSFDLSMWPRVLRSYQELRVPAEQLSLIVPQFEVPLPPLEPAVFPPNFQELQPPQLELFDLDELFSSPEKRLSQLANKCEESDIEYFIREAGEITGVSNQLPKSQKHAKGILEHIVAKLYLFKKAAQESAEMTAAGLYDVRLLQDKEEEEDRDSHFNQEIGEQMFSDIEDFDDL
ncbi:unnamed protein product [Caenorhabditis auriculariae]|uniref:ABC-type uncharacterized transport system domain-containing protein n=1 Tax=Caenorhabditis auriculariae TaxID=2777116 RepID=A0A8S1HG12_9PELO|nr:unnamed protein product [Caenorhabditis auriculariae]